MDIITIIAGILTLVCSIGAIVTLVSALKLILVSTSAAKWQYFCELASIIFLILLSLGLMVGSIIVISEQLGFCSHNQVMYLWALAYQPYYAVIIITLLFCGMNLINSGLELR